MKFNLKNKTLLITGGLGDFGKVIVKKFVELGCNAIITTTKKSKEKNSKKIKILYLDFKDENSIYNFEKKIKNIKKIDYLINNAGINILDSIYNIKKKNLLNITNINLIGPTWLTSIIAAKMKKNKSGKIINISSIYGSVSKEKRSLYSITKFGLNGLTKSSALDLAKFNILVNSISPGVFNTKLTRKILKKNGMKKVKLKIPLKKLGNPEMLANLCIFLCSNYNNYITGQNIIIDGGYTSH
mgnify:FL=1|tara:strand:+ start:281 stop:1006 length:726 start_codon:yes stop_codon:yes gene_type:complete